MKRVIHISGRDSTLTCDRTVTFYPDRPTECTARLLNKKTRQNAADVDVLLFRGCLCCSVTVYNEKLSSINHEGNVARKIVMEKLMNAHYFFYKSYLLNLNASSFCISLSLERIRIKAQESCSGSSQ